MHYFNYKTAQNSFMILIFFLLNGCVSADELIGINEWSKKYVEANEKVLCLEEINGDYYFVSSNNKNVKAGYLIEITGSSSKPKTYVFSWGFKNKKGEFLETKSPPVDIKSGYVRYGNKMYSENITYRDLFLEKTNSLYITVEVKKFEEGEESQVKAQNIELCNVVL